MNLYGSLSVYSNKIISTPPININDNISYEGILKHRKYRCDSSVSFFYLFIVNYDEGIGRESFSFKINLRSP
jgi:hypothetical protein